MSHVRMQICAGRRICVIEQVDIFVAVRCQNLGAQRIVDSTSDGHIARFLLKISKKRISVTPIRRVG